MGNYQWIKFELGVWMQTMLFLHVRCHIFWPTGCPKEEEDVDASEAAVRGTGGEGKSRRNEGHPAHV